MSLYLHTFYNHSKMPHWILSKPLHIRSTNVTIFLLLNEISCNAKTAVAWHKKCIWAKKYGLSISLTFWFLRIISKICTVCMLAVVAYQVPKLRLKWPITYIRDIQEFISIVLSLKIGLSQCTLKSKLYNWPLNKLYKFKNKMLATKLFHTFLFLSFVLLSTFSIITL